MDDCGISPLRTLLIGLGNQGREHCEAVMQCPLFEIAAGVDSDAGRLANKFPFPVYSGLDQALALHPEAAIVATPPATYADLVPDLMKAGLHLLLEKPFGVTVRSAVDFTLQAHKAGLVLQPAVQRRFHPSYQAWEAARKTIGNVLEAFFTLHITHRPKDWRCREAAQGGGALFDLGFHAIDLAVRWFGPMRLVYAAFYDQTGIPLHYASDARAEILLQTETEIPVRLSVAREMPTKKEYVWVRGDTGTLLFDRQRCCLFEVMSAVPEEGGTMLVENEGSWDHAMQEQLHCFYRSITDVRAGGVPADSSPWDGINAMRIMGRAYTQGENE